MVDEQMRIGPYRILGSLGTGGMGIVYRAEHVDSKRVAALKTVRLPSPQWLAGIRREILALTRLRHPGVVRIIAQGVQEGLPWYAMDLLEGETLRSVIRRRFGDLSVPRARTTMEDGFNTVETVTANDVVTRVASGGGRNLALISNQPPRAEVQPLSAEYQREILRIMGRLCGTLAYLHGEGIVNGDLKPENVLLMPDRNPVIIDFGLTSTFGGAVGREALESSRGLAGTLPYIAPEEIRNEFV
ncbi:MAG: eukaryotic-like serine/threonine-protein kinase, partial [Myxococcales bacterium]|nr:eukaryotic-like serine/threonine-protein kinase [Myxococcales bacterium]